MTKLLALAPHGADKLRLEGGFNSHGSYWSYIPGFDIFISDWHISLYVTQFYSADIIPHKKISWHNNDIWHIIQVSVVDDLRQLSSETDGWLSIHRVAMEDHFKIAKPHRINKIVELLEYKLAKALK